VLSRAIFGRIEAARRNWDEARGFESNLSATSDAIRLLVHELGDEYAGNHLSSQYHEALCRIGTKLHELDKANELQKMAVVQSKVPELMPTPLTRRRMHWERIRRGRRARPWFHHVARLAGPYKTVVRAREESKQERTKIMTQFETEQQWEERNMRLA